MSNRLSSFQIKLIAISIMVIDHAGALFFPGILFIRIIGRLAFPLFAFLITEGFRHTRSLKRYLFRLGLCAVLFQIPDWFFGSEMMRNAFISLGWQSVPYVEYVLNIFATLFLGLSAIALFESLKGKYIAYSWIAVVSLAAVAEIIGADYGAYGVLYMVVFYLAEGNIRKMLAGVVVLHTGYAICEGIGSYFSSHILAFPHAIQLYSILSIGIIALYNHEQGRKMKYFFYIFYPVHLILLYAIDAFL